MTSQTQLEITHAGRGLVMATFGAISVALWQIKPTLSLFEIQREGLAAVVRKHPGRAAFLCIVQTSADPPDQEIRNASTQMITGHGPNLAAVACVIEGSGFRAAITRTVLTGIVFVIRNPQPFRFLETVEAASDWLATRLGSRSVFGLAEQVAKARQGLSEAERRVTMTA